MSQKYGCAPPAAAACSSKPPRLTARPDLKHGYLHIDQKHGYLHIDQKHGYLQIYQKHGYLQIYQKHGYLQIYQTYAFGLPETQREMPSSSGSRRRHVGPCPAGMGSLRGPERAARLLARPLGSAIPLH